MDRRTRADRWMNGQMGGGLNGWLDGWINGQMSAWVDRGVDRQMEDRWADRRTHGQGNEWQGLGSTVPGFTLNPQQ